MKGLEGPGSHDPGVPQPGTRPEGLVGLRPWGWWVVKVAVPEVVAPEPERAGDVDLGWRGALD